MFYFKREYIDEEEDCNLFDEMYIFGEMYIGCSKCNRERFYCAYDLPNYGDYIVTDSEIVCECGHRNRLIAKDESIVPTLENRIKEINKVIKEYDREENSTIRALLLVIVGAIIIFIGINVVYCVFGIIIYLGFNWIFSNSTLSLYITISIWLIVSDMLIPFLKLKNIPIIFNSDQIKALSHLIRVLMFIVITIADYTKTSFLFSVETWAILKGVIYPAIITAIFFESFLKAVSLCKKRGEPNEPPKNEPV